MSRHYQTLDAMRGIAACAVLTLHISRLFGLKVQFNNAHLGVDFFFLLSGFVIANAYEEKLRAGWPIISFVRKRLVRLYPMIIVGGALGLSVLVLRQAAYRDLGWAGILLAAGANVMLIPSRALLNFRLFGFPLNSPFWSLSAEMVVNLGYALTMRLPTTRALVFVAAVAFVALAGVGLVRSTIDVGYTWADYGLGVVRALFPFLLGVLLWRTRERLPNLGALSHLAVPLVGIILLEPVALPPLVELAVIALAFPLLIVLGLSCVPRRELKWLWSGLGELSYPLYAVHYPIVVVFAQMSKQHHLVGGYQWGLAALCGVAAISTALISLWGFDRPLRRRLEQRRLAVELRAAPSGQT
jgi:peptidoglycan/LPS O-acetylase OafA/YrhL